MKFRSSVTVSLLAIAALAAAAFVACGGGGEEIVRERAGVKMTLSADRAVYKVGDSVKLRAEVENVSGESLTYRTGDESNVAIELRVDSDLGGRQVLNGSDEDQNESGPLVLEGGGKLRAELDWDQLLALYQTPAQAPAGDYVVTATFLLADPAGSPDVSEFTAALTLTLEGGREILSVSEALLFAVQQPEMLEWASVRGVVGSVCLYQPTQTYFIASLVEPEITETISGLYDAQIRNGDPICSPVSIGEEWRVQFVNANGPSPNRVAVNMDLYTGSNARFDDTGFEPPTDSQAD